MNTMATFQPAGGGHGEARDGTELPPNGTSPASGAEGEPDLRADLEEAAGNLEAVMSPLRVQLRHAAITGEQDRANAIRAELDRAESDWDRIYRRLEALGGGPAAVFPAAKGALRPLREQVADSLRLLQVPATPRHIAAVHGAFFGSTFPTTRVTSLKRDEKNSFDNAAGRPYYICPALSAYSLTPQRGLLAISAWPLDKRMIGPDSPRADFLTGAINLAKAYERLPAETPGALQLLAEFAAHIPGSRQGEGPVSPQAVIRAARAQLEEIGDRDSRARAEAAERAGQLDAGEQLFGRPPDPVDAAFSGNFVPSAPAGRAARQVLHQPGTARSRHKL